MEKSKEPLYASVLILLALIWGSSYILMREGLKTFTPLQVAGFRVFITWFCFLPISIRNLKYITRRNIRSFLLISIAGNFFPSFLFPLAQTRIESSLAGMLNSLSPVFTLIVGLFFYSRTIKPLQTIGVALGMLGALGLLYRGGLAFNYYGLFVVLATLLYGISANEIGTVKGLSGFGIMSLAFFFVGPFAGTVLLFSGVGQSFTSPGWKLSFASIILLSVAGTFVANSLYSWLIIRKSPMYAVSVTYLSPVVSTAWGIFLNEKISTVMIISISVILTGVYLITRAGAKVLKRSEFKVPDAT
ncbi:MAG: EamA family transporter [Bacteroidales bacterium]|jgi:drug/metabolite transporter (DMT)-like permease|nr:EamA family transporter [Bacteroidales bacterium]